MPRLFSTLNKQAAFYFVMIVPKAKEHPFLNAYHRLNDPIGRVKPRLKFGLYLVKLHPVGNIVGGVNQALFHGGYYVFKIGPGSVTAAH